MVAYLRVAGAALFSSATTERYRDDPAHTSVLKATFSYVSCVQTSGSAHTGQGTHPPRSRSAFPVRAVSFSDSTAIVVPARG